MFYWNSLYYYILLYRKYVIFLISFSKFSDVLPAFNFASAIGNLWSIYLGVNILRPSPYFVLLLASDTILV